MQYRVLGHTGIKVSLIGLGTMTWGQQNTEAEAHAQIDYALERGINLVDAAEMYPVPPKAETQGRTETYIGTWLARTGRRKDIILATKAAGRQHDPTRPSHIRGGRTTFSREHLVEAVNESLKRLQTDYVDLYQLHWPDRNTNTFGKLAYPWPQGEEHSVPILETLQALAELIKAGKIRHIGVSNETPWGVAQFLKHAETAGLPKIASIQNPYSLLNRLYETGLSEFTRFEGVGLLAYSPLGMGMLAGKYHNGAKPEGARLTLFDRFTRYSNAEAIAASHEYVELARAHGLSPAQMALAWVNEQPFVTSNLVGATSVAQLKEDIDSLDVKLSPDVIKGIQAIHKRHPSPSP
jgi:aryl-alcohol dehydrogenase-like predicted oxidoreductase